MFISIVLSVSTVFVIVATLLWKQLITNRKKRQQRLRSLSSRLPQVRSSDPQKLERRRLRILERSRHRKKALMMQSSNLRQHLHINDAEIHPSTSSDEDCDDRLVAVSSPDRSPPPEPITPDPKTSQDNLPPLDDGYGALETETLVGVSPSLAPLELSLERSCLEEEEEKEEMRAEKPVPTLLLEERPTLLPMDTPGSREQLPPGDSGYSLLASLMKKKNQQSLKGYKCFPGMTGPTNHSFVSGHSLVADEEHLPPSSMPHNLLHAQFSNTDDSSEDEPEHALSPHAPWPPRPSPRSNTLPDSYKYLSKSPVHLKKKIACYQNPYTTDSYQRLDPAHQAGYTFHPSAEPSLRSFSDSEGAYAFTQFDVSPFAPKESPGTHSRLHRKKNSTELRRIQAAYKGYGDPNYNSFEHSSLSSSSSSVDAPLRESLNRPDMPKRIVPSSSSDPTTPREDKDESDNTLKPRSRSCTTERMLRLSEERCRNRDIDPNTTQDDDFDHLLDGVDLHDWNERFQRIMTTIRKFTCNTPIALQIKANRALIHLAQDFIYASSTYGKIIISEVYSAEKTIKPINLGGKLGGTKYIVQNILFKFAVDESGLYSDYAAAKVAGHELKGLINYFNCNIEDLCLPLMSLVDYRGFRLIAMSILPIRGAETIIYGSDDYGETIHNRSFKLQSLLKKAARMMNIKEHQCGINPHRSNSLCSPADLEGHLGTDNRFYLLDFSRVLPPETPVKGIRNAHLYRLLRPEHVKLFSTPLCSDAFSGFIANFNYGEDNLEAVQSTDKLINETIPEFAHDLNAMMEEARDKGRLESFRLTEAIHRQGINVRYIGLLRKHIKELDCRTFLLVEMCARIVKNKLRKLLRKKMKELKVPLEEPYRRLVISYLNLVLGDSEASEEYWTTNIKKSLKRTFIAGLSKQESEESYPLKSSLNNFSNDRVDGKLLLFLRLQKMTGLRFTNRINEEFTQNPNNWAPRGAQPLDETDLEDIGLRVKHMNIISHAQGFVLQMKGAMAWAHDPVAAERFYNMAITKYEEALDTNPNDYQALIRCAEIAVQFIEGHARGVAAMKYNIEMPQVQYANLLYQRAATANPNDSYGLYRYAQFLDKCNIPRTAEEMFLRSLEAEPENVACLQEYGNFLSENSQHDVAELFFVRGSELAQELIPQDSNVSETQQPPVVPPVRKKVTPHGL